MGASAKFGFFMKAYGHSRRDKIECKFGCCGTNSLPFKHCRKIVDRANRKTARQYAKNVIVFYLVVGDL